MIGIEKGIELALWDTIFILKLQIAETQDEQLIAQGKKTTGHVAGSLKHGKVYEIAFEYQNNM